MIDSVDLEEEQCIDWNKHSFFGAQRITLTDCLPIDIAVYLRLGLLWP